MVVSLYQTKMKWKLFKNNIKSISLICSQHFKIKLIQWIILWHNKQLIKEMRLTKSKRRLLRNLPILVLTKTIKVVSTLEWSWNPVFWKLLNFKLTSILIKIWKVWIKRKPIFLITKSKVWSNKTLMNSSNYFYCSKEMEGTKDKNLITIAVPKIMELDYNIPSLLQTLTILNNSSNISSNNSLEQEVELSNLASPVLQLIMVINSL